jgi:hydrogenase maturation protein HypF
MEPSGGGEFLLANQGNFQRVGHLRTFPLPGGELAVRQPRYAALGLLHELGIVVENSPLASEFTREEQRVAQTQLERGLNTPLSSCAGRLFEGVAALLGIRTTNQFEAQAAMELEFAAGDGVVDARSEAGALPIPIPMKEGGVADWEPMLRSLLAALEAGEDPSALAARFLESMSQLILEVARRERRSVVVLSGGCFQNVVLLERTVARLREEGFNPLWPRRVPPNDGGLAFGQAVVASTRLARDLSR